MNNASVRASKTGKPVARVAPVAVSYRDHTVVDKQPAACMQTVAYKKWVRPLYQYLTGQYNAPVLTAHLLETGEWEYLKPLPLRLRVEAGKILLAVYMTGSKRVLQKTDEINVVRVQAVLQVLALLHELYPTYLDTTIVPFEKATGSVGVLSRLVAVPPRVSNGQFRAIGPSIAQCSRYFSRLQWREAIAPLTTICRELSITVPRLLDVVVLPGADSLKQYKEWIEALVHTHGQMLAALERAPELAAQYRCLCRTLRTASGVGTFPAFRVVVCYQSLLTTVMTSLNALIKRYNQRIGASVAVWPVERVAVSTLEGLFEVYAPIKKVD
jgi:hypothetical protein